MSTVVHRTKTTPVYERTLASQAKTVVNVGGAGSSKSFSIAQIFIDKLITEKNKVFVVMCKTMPACKRGPYDLIINMLKEAEIYDSDRHNKSDHFYKLGSNIMWFMSLDEPAKVKSISGGISYVWLEEANEFTYEDYTIIKLQVRRVTGDDERNHLYLSLNPTDESNWIAKKLIFQEDVEVFHSTYLDNPLLEKDAVGIIEGLINEDENFYRVYALGEWGRLEDLIYSNWDEVDELPWEYDAMAYGLDFGFEKPMALIKVILFKGEIYLDEVVYERKRLNSSLIERLSHVDKADIYADPEAPDKIQEIFNAGYNIYPANNAVQMGFDVCKRQVLHITKQSINVLKEVKGYHRKKDKDGNTLEEPVKYNDHACDAFRYGTVGIVERFGFATVRPGSDKPRTKRSFRI